MGKQLAESVWEQTLENKESSKTFHQLNQGKKFDMENYRPNNNQWGLHEDALMDSWMPL